MATAAYQSEVSKRYARALYDVLGDQGADKVLVQLRKIQSLFSQASISEIVASPALSREERRDVLQKLFLAAGIDDGLLAFVRLLSDKNRIQIFSEIVNSFESISDSKNKVLRGVVASREDLSLDEKKEIEKVISEFTRASLILEYKKNPSMLGGVRAQVGSYTFDGSIDSQFKKMREQIVNKN